MLLELPALPQVPGADSVVKPSSPQFCPVMGDVNTAGSICVALELPETTQDIKRQVGNKGKLSHPSNNEGVLRWWPNM